MTRKKTNIEGIVAGGNGTPGKVASRSSTENVSKPNKSSKSTVSPAGNLSVPKDNRSSGLRKGAAKLKKSLSRATGVVSRNSEGPKEKEPIALYETPIRHRPPRPSTASQTMTIEQVKVLLGMAVGRKSTPHIMSIISNNHETINKEIGSSNTEIIDLVTEAAYDVKDARTGKTAHEIAKIKKESKKFLEVVRNALGKLAYRNPPTRPNRTDLKHWGTMSYLNEFEPKRNKDYHSLSKSSLSLSVNQDREQGDKTVIQGALEVQNKAGETPPDVAKESGNKKFTYEPVDLSKIKRVTLSKPPVLPANTNETILAPEEQKLQVQDNLVPYGGKLEHLTKTRPKGPSRRRPSKHKPLIEIEDHIQEKKPTPDVTPARDAGIHGRQNRLIPASATLMTLPSQKEKPTPDVIPARGAGIQGKENIVPTKQKPAVSGNSDKDVPLKKQSNNRNFYTVGCALLAVGCFVAAAIIKSKMLCIIGAVIAVAAAITWYLTPSSKVESMNISDLAGAGPHCMRI